MNGYTVKISVGLKNNPDAVKIRQEVFIAEQGFTEEFDQIDETAVHCVIYEGERAVATGRLFEQEGDAHIGRVAVIKSCRGKALGTLVVRTLEDYAKNQGYEICALSAQTRVQEFYESLGYKPSGEVYLDEFCPHIMMKKTL